MKPVKITGEEAVALIIILNKAPTRELFMLHANCTEDEADMMVEHVEAGRAKLWTIAREGGYRGPRLLDG